MVVAIEGLSPHPSSRTQDNIRHEPYANARSSTSVSARNASPTSSDSTFVNDPPAPVSRPRASYTALRSMHRRTHQKMRELFPQGRLTVNRSSTMTSGPHRQTVQDYGVFAARDFVRGAIIFIQAPAMLFFWHPIMRKSNCLELSVVPEWNQLDAKTQRRIIEYWPQQLAKVEPRVAYQVGSPGAKALYRWAFDKVLRWEHNAIDYPGDVVSGGVWLAASYINHACDPSVAIVVDRTSAYCRIIALRDMSMGEGLFSDYIANSARPSIDSHDYLCDTHRYEGRRGLRRKIWDRMTGRYKAIKYREAAGLGNRSHPPAF